MRETKQNQKKKGQIRIQSCRNNSRKQKADLVCRPLLSSQWSRSRSYLERRDRARFSAERLRSVARFHKTLRSLVLPVVSESHPDPARPVNPSPATWQLAKSNDISLSTKAANTSKASDTRSALSRAKRSAMQFDSYLPAFRFKFKWIK